MTSKGIKTVAYIRVSTDKQADLGMSLEAQQKKVRAYADLYELDLVDIIVESKSAKSLRRPGLQQALGLLRDGTAGALLVTKLDRLTRSVCDLGFLVKHYFAEKHDLMSVAENIDTCTPAGRLVLNVLASVSQWEREAIGERTKEAMQLKKSKGEFTGGKIPYGYRLASDGVHLVELPREQVTVGLVRELLGKGYSKRRVARELTSRGIQSRRGSKWNHSQIARMAIDVVVPGVSLAA